MALELNLSFKSPDQLMVCLGGSHTDTLTFVSPITPAELKEISWYFETYAALYTTEVDDHRAKRIAGYFPEWGDKLFSSVFYDQHSFKLFQKFQSEYQHSRFITISATHPTILALPWELLRNNGSYLCHGNPSISVRRRIRSDIILKKSYPIKQKGQIRLLFIVSRPADADYIDHRSDSIAVLDALAQSSSSCIDVEFLRPPTLDMLVQRLENNNRPNVNIIHFDGHGFFDGKMGFISFTSARRGTEHYVSAEELGNILDSKGISLVVLSTCKSSTVGEDPLGSVAIRLTQSGVPTVIAMPHSAHIATTRALFASFYKYLSFGKALGESLDCARGDLYNRPDRIQSQRGQTSITLQLCDWFLPTLYQGTEDQPLLIGRDIDNQVKNNKDNLLYSQRRDFFGRSKELWQIEWAFVQKKARRITISGIRGEGKTYLAIEAGQWLCRTKLFQKMCLVDFAVFQGDDAVGWAIISLARTLDCGFLDANSVSSILHNISCLIIFDNVEALPPKQLTTLLNVGQQWSDIGDCRVMLTTRFSDLDHPAFSDQSTSHEHLRLKGFSPEDSLAYFKYLIASTNLNKVTVPERAELLQLFKQVDFHPLSIGLLANCLSGNTIKKINEQLLRMLEQDSNNPFLTSLQLFIGTLGDKSLMLMSRLGVFQGGALVSHIKSITESSQKQLSNTLDKLSFAGLLQYNEKSSGTTKYVRFHPSLSPFLWQHYLTQGEKEKLCAIHAKYYYELVLKLRNKDLEDPYYARNIAFIELSNLLYALNNALDAGEVFAIDFADKVNWFLDRFGLYVDREHLSEKVRNMPAKIGTGDWFKLNSNRGEQLYNDKKFHKASELFLEILKGLGEPTTIDYANTLDRLGRCYLSLRQTDSAIDCYNHGLQIVEQLPPDRTTKRQLGVLHNDLADVLFLHLRNYNEAIKHYELAREVMNEIHDQRALASINGNLGVIAMEIGDLQEAIQRYNDALVAFQQLNEPICEAMAWHQLGMAYSKNRQFADSEEAYREAARIFEFHDNDFASRTWNEMGLLMKNIGNLEQAESFFRRAVNANRRNIEDPGQLADTLNNLADILQTRVTNIEEAMRIAEESLSIKINLDPNAVEIWKTYHILSKIAGKLGDLMRSDEYLIKCLESYNSYPGAVYKSDKINEIVAFVTKNLGSIPQNYQIKSELNVLLKGREKLEKSIVDVIKGERNRVVLCEQLGWEDSLIIISILRDI